MNSLLSIINKTLSDDVTSLMTKKNKGVSNILACRRLNMVAKYSGNILIMLAEPWVSNSIEKTMIHSARIHLYARVLDDALDENLPIHRLLLLRSQYLLCSSISALSLAYPNLTEEMLLLIEETTSAVEKDNDNPTISLWGVKNHHLLVIPLLLSGNDKKWNDNKKYLSDFIWIMQASDEWRQGLIKNKKIRFEVLDKIESILSSNAPKKLAENNWNLAAKRILWESKQLLTSLSKRN